MMMRKSNALIVQTIVIIFLSTLLSSCGVIIKEYMDSTREDREYVSYGYFSFEKATILYDLSQGRTDTFEPLATPANLWWDSNTPPVHWSQDDYYRIARAFFEKVWGESPDGWGLKKLEFQLNCESIENGPQLGIIWFYKVYKDGNLQVRIEREITILPTVEEIHWAQSRITNARQNSGIDLARFKYPVERVLQLAENIGGRDSRLNVDNNCDIDIWLIPEWYNGAWEVDYTGHLSESYERIFLIFIDPYTGNYKINKPK
jgi:hypothetical protein